MNDLNPDQQQRPRPMERPATPLGVNPGGHMLADPRSARISVSLPKEAALQDSPIINPSPAASVPSVAPTPTPATSPAATPTPWGMAQPAASAEAKSITITTFNRGYGPVTVVTQGAGNETMILATPGTDDDLAAMVKEWMRRVKAG